MIDNNGAYLTEGAFDFTDFTVTEAALDAVIDSITIGDLTAEKPMTVAVETKKTQPYAGIYKYTVGGNTVKSGRIAAGGTIPALDYSESYLGQEIKLVFKPLSVYNVWGSEVTSNAYTIPVEAVAAKAALLSLENEDGDVIIDVEETSDVEFGNVTSVKAAVELTADKAPGKAMLYLALYDSNGRLLEVKTKPATVAANTTSGQRVETDAVDLTGKDVKRAAAFVWYESAPLSDAVSAEK